MFEEQAPIKLFIKTTKQVIKELEEIQEVDLSKFKDSVEDAFDNYNVDGVEELVGFDNWNELKDGSHELTIKIDHEDAYEFTIHTTVKDSKATVTNVL